LVAAAESKQRHEQERRRQSVRKRSAWTVVTATLAAGLWACSQRGMIDALQGSEPAQPSVVRSKIPGPTLTEASKVAQDSMSSATSQKVSVVITAKEEAWLEAEADGQPVFAKLLLANQTKSFDALRQIKIRTGNLAGINISYNGRTIGPLGDIHRVGMVLFTPEGWKPAR
jgi:uncharacterized protein DUF4115